MQLLGPSVCRTAAAALAAVQAHVSALEWVSQGTSRLLRYAVRKEKLHELEKTRFEQDVSLVAL